MHKAVLVFMSLLMSSSVFAKTIPSSKIEIAPSSIDQVVRLVDKRESGHTKVNIIVEELGMSTDVSPRYTVYLGFASLGEMGNIYADFKIDDAVWEFKSATRIAAGIYEVQVVGFDENYEMREFTYTIDTTQMFIDERKARKKCGGDFCDQELNTTIEVKTSVK
ncbi:hypothetical protein [Bdellovibrio reynosensis]|uniref:Uncharacterized protein n=1 Tax=Bdellovibrio reynosensis TaxID=2835041 RepID=A0ABY4CGL9_9BACT|nr:hypothetical protein [Bdellovibrio reynosensis]UOF02713.1 hypothetical protein MNR06_07090 [Bdellovibrio reynosensis]